MAPCHAALRPIGPCGLAVQMPVFIVRRQRAAIPAGLGPAPAGRPGPSKHGGNRHQFLFKVLMWGTGRWVAYPGPNAGLGSYMWMLRVSFGF